MAGKRHEDPELHVDVYPAYQRTGEYVRGGGGLDCYDY